MIQVEESVAVQRVRDVPFSRGINLRNSTQNLPNNFNFFCTDNDVGCSNTLVITKLYLSPIDFVITEVHFTLLFHFHNLSYEVTGLRIHMYTFYTVASHTQCTHIFSWCRMSLHWMYDDLRCLAQDKLPKM